MSVNSFSGQPAIPASYGFTAGKNKIINGDFGIWQRGTSFSLSTGGGTFTADRYQAWYNGTGATRTLSQQAFTPASAPVSGYEGTYYHRYAQTVAGTGGTYNNFGQKIEDVRSLTGTYTFSFWARVSSGTTVVQGFLEQSFGSGGSASTYTQFGSDFTVTTSWQRFSGTLTVPSISGKTIGTGSSAVVYLGFLQNTTFTLDTWGWQVEAGATATSFQTATGTIQGELAACQRYYIRYTGGSAYGMLSTTGAAMSSTLTRNTFPFPVEMRTVPSSVDYSTIRFLDTGSVTGAITAANLLSVEQSAKVAYVEFTSSGLTQHRPTWIESNASATGYVAFNAEL
jgi:hypothetical protein